MPPAPRLRPRPHRPRSGRRCGTRGFDSGAQAPRRPRYPLVERARRGSNLGRPQMAAAMRPVVGPPTVALTLLLHEMRTNGSLAAPRLDTRGVECLMPATQATWPGGEQGGVSIMNDDQLRRLIARQATRRSLLKGAGAASLAAMAYPVFRSSG